VFRRAFLIDFTAGSALEGAVKGGLVDKAIAVDCKCPFCGKVNSVVVPESGLEAYNNGEHVQVAFPELTADQREMVKTGICVECWNKMFKTAS
jgi:hypothetical protein